MFITNSQMPTFHRCKPNRYQVIYKISIEISMQIININNTLMQPQYPQFHLADTKQDTLTVHTESQVSLMNQWIVKILNDLFLNIYHQILMPTKKELNGFNTIELFKTLNQKLNKLSNVLNKMKDLFL